MQTGLCDFPDGLVRLGPFPLISPFSVSFRMSSRFGLRILFFYLFPFLFTSCLKLHDFLAVTRLQNALCGAFMLPFSLSLSLSLISSSSVVGSRSATLDLAMALLLRWNGASTCSGPYCGSHLSSGSSAPVSASAHPTRCSDHPVQGMEPVVLYQFSAMSVCGGILALHLSWHCISPGTSTFTYCYCETSVLCCTFWMYCSLWQLQRSLQRVDDRVDILHLVDLVSL